MKVDKEAIRMASILRPQASVKTVQDNEEGVAVNVAAVATNAQALASLLVDAQSSAAAIAANLAAIQSNDADIAASVISMQTSAVNIATNVAAIQSNDADIAAIQAQTAVLQGLTDALSVADAALSASVSGNTSRLDALYTTATASTTDDWNDVPPTGGLHSVLLRGLNPNGPGGSSYFYCVQFKHGNSITQVATPYAYSVSSSTSPIMHRSYYVAVGWLPWRGSAI